MIKISEDIKKLYIEDSTPIELEVRFKDNAFPTIKGSDVLSEQMTLHESICEEEQLKFGGCNASSFELTVYGLDKRVKGKEIMPVLITNKTEIPLGVFCIDTVEKFAGKDYVKITAYDRIKYFDTDVKDWYKNLVFPITIKNFRNSLCKYIGIEQKETSLIVDDIVLQKDIDYTSNVNGLTILQNICEISGVFGRIDRYGKLDYLSLANEKALDIPSSLVYEYPVVEDFETKIIDGAIIVDSEGAEYATDIRTNPYYIRDNFVIIGQAEATIKNIATKLVEKINGIKYVPVSISKIKGQPYAECGDYVHGEIKGYAFGTYIFKREITGIKVLRDSYVAKGKEYLENDINSVTSTLLKLNEMIGRTRTSIKKTEDGLTIEIQKAVEASNKYSDGVADTAKSEAIKNTDEKLKNYSTTEEMQTAIKASEKGFSVIVSSTIKNSEEEFYLSDSPNFLIGGSWSKTQPTLTDGKYIWQRTLITRGNDETEYSPSEKGVCITGNTGAKGDPGDKGDPGAKGDPGTDGKSIGSVVNYYLATNLSSNVSTSTTGWTTSVQSVSESKKYLWNYEVIKYTDGTVASTTTPCIIGSYGDTGLKGDTGVGISSITEHYAVSQSNTTAPTSWSTTVPNMTTTNKYLWNYETVAYTNNTSKDTGKRVIGVYGDKGSKGDAGKGVQSSKITYQVSSSGTAIPTGTWSDSIPSISAGQYLWTKTVITYTDNTTSTSYSVGRNGTNGKNGNDGKGIKSTEVTYQAGASGTTAPTGTWQSSPRTTSASLPYMWTKTVITYTDNTTSTSYSVGCTPEGIQVGGRNLLLNSWDLTKWNTESGTTVTADSDGWFKIATTKNSSWWSTEQYATLEAGVYTISGQAKKGSKAGYINIIKASDNTIVMVHKNMDYKFVFTFTLSETTTVRIHLGLEPTTSGDYVYFKLPKLEKGNKATDWTPAPEDVDAQIQTVSTQVTKAQTEISSTKESIKLLATKTEVTTVSNNLTALSRTVSNQQTAIEQNAESITLRATKDEVATAVNNIQVGGRNLLVDSNSINPSGTDFAGKSVVDFALRKIKVVASGSFNRWIFCADYISGGMVGGEIIKGEVYTFSADIKTENLTQEGAIVTFDLRKNYTPISAVLIPIVPNKNGIWQKLSGNITVPIDQQPDNCLISIGYVRNVADFTGTEFYYRNFKLEKGNKATDWTPAPEDQVNVGEVVNHVNSELKISGNCINLTTGHFTIDSDNIKVSEAGDLTITGDLTSQGALKVVSGDISGSISINNKTGYDIKSYALMSDLSVLVGDSQLIGKTAFEVESNASIFRMPDYTIGTTAQFTYGNFTDTLGGKNLAISGNAGIGGTLSAGTIKTSAGANLDSVASSLSSLSSTVSSHGTSISNLSTLATKNTLLWSGASWPNENSSLTLKEKVSAQPKGIVLVWSTSSNKNDFQYTYIPKYHVSAHSGKSVYIMLSDAMGDKIAKKIVYIYDDKVVGQELNDNDAYTKSGITFRPQAFVLVEILGV